MKATKKQQFIKTIDEHKKIIYKIVNSYCPNKNYRKDLEKVAPKLKKSHPELYNLLNQI